MNPFQVRSQEEIMNECQVWWTITGNFGNMMPIDWSKSTTRAKQLPTLNLRNPRAPPGSGVGSANSGGRHFGAKRGVPGGFPGGGGGVPPSLEDALVDNLEDEDDMVAADLDMHSLILSSNPQEHAVSRLTEYEKL